MPDAQHHSNSPFLAPAGALMLAALSFSAGFCLSDNLNKDLVWKEVQVPTNLCIHAKIARSEDYSRVYGANLLINCASDGTHAPAPVSGSYTLVLKNSQTGDIMLTLGPSPFTEGDTSIAAYPFEAGRLLNLDGKNWVLPGQRAIEVNFRHDADPSKVITHVIPL